MRLNNLRKQNKSSFTLIELLVVLALVAILSVVVILTLNPAELLKQARDSNRLSDLATINTALNLFSTDVTSGFMGTSTVVYVSIPDNASSTCGSLGLPALPTGYTYNCVATANLRNTDGTGWIPVNFQRISSNSPISQLPIDPINTTSTGSYYTYVTGGSWILTAIPESQKQKTELSNNPHLSKFPGTIGVGNNLDISPLYNSNGLVGYWKLDEGSGAVAKDSSGNGNNGTLTNSPPWAAGKVGGAISFNATNKYITFGTSTALNLTSEATLALWFSPNSLAGNQHIFGKSDTSSYMLSTHYSGLGFSFWGPVGGVSAHCEKGSLYTSTGTWYFAVVTYDGSAKHVYFNGRRVLSCSKTGSIGVDSNPLMLNRSANTNGLVDEVRIYNRALSAAEILALYNATK